jgi:hypothetical protein
MAQAFEEDRTKQQSAYPLKTINCTAQIQEGKDERWKKLPAI